MTELKLDSDNLPKCTNCGRVLIREGYPHALLQAINDVFGQDVGYAHNAYRCINCFSPPNWEPIYDGGELLRENFPPPNLVVQIKDALNEYVFGMVINGRFLAIDHEFGHLTEDHMITHWRMLDIVEFPEGNN